MITYSAIAYFGFDFLFSLPWNQHVFYGWLAELLYSLLTAASYFLISTTFLSFFIAICLQHTAISEIFSNLINNIDNINSTNKHRRKMHKKHCLKVAVEFHVSAIW